MSGVEIFTRDVNGVAIPVSDTHPLPTTGGAGGGTDMGPTNTLLGPVTETAPATDTASSGLNGRLQRASQRLTSLIALLPASLGSKASASSLAITWATEDAARIGNINEAAPANDTASSGLNGRLQRIAQNVSSTNALLPTSIGQKARAASLAVAQSAEDQAQIGGSTEAAPASDTASSGLNGRLQRIAQRLTTMITSGLASVGLTAVGSAITAPPMTIGGRVATAWQTPLVDGQVTNAAYDKTGRMIIADGMRDMKGSNATTITNTTSNIVVPANANYFQDIYSVIVTNRGAASGWVTFYDNGSPVFLIYCPMNDTRSLVLGPSGAIPQAAINTVWQAQASVVSTFEIHIMTMKAK